MTPKGGIMLTLVVSMRPESWCQCGTSGVAMVVVEGTCDVRLYTRVSMCLLVVSDVRIVD